MIEEPQEWIEKNHPSGDIDWKWEFMRLLIASTHFLAHPDSEPYKTILKVAIEVGESLLEKDKTQKWSDTHGPK